MRQTLSAPTPPTIEPDDHCYAPYECPFWEHCTKDKPERWIYYLPGSRQAFHDLTALGVQTIEDIPVGYPLQLVQQPGGGQAGRRDRRRLVEHDHGHIAGV
jgi:hypothetical protein